MLRRSGSNPASASSRQSTKKRRTIEDVLEENEQLIDDLEVLAAEIKVRFGAARGMPGGGRSGGAANY